MAENHPAPSAQEVRPKLVGFSIPVLTYATPEGFGEDVSYVYDRRWYGPKCTEYGSDRWKVTGRRERTKMRKAVVAILLNLVAVNAFAGGVGLISKPSPYSVPETMDRLAAILQSKGMTVFARIDHAAEARKVGLALGPTQLLVFGNPRGGTPLMAAAPTVAIDLPLKALAWEDTEGKVWLSYNTPSYLRERHGIEGKDDALKALAGALGAAIDRALE